MGLPGPRPVASVGGNRYLMVVTDDYSRYTRVSFLNQKSDSAEASKTFLADLNYGGITYAVQCVRSVIFGEFITGAFAKLCRDRGIRQQLILPDTPKLKGVAARALHMNVEAAHAACLQAQKLFPFVTLPATGNLPGEACS